MLLPTHYLSAWAGLLLPGLCQTVDLPRPMAPLVLLFRNRPSGDTLKGLVDARSSFYYEEAMQNGLLPVDKNFYRGELQCLEPVELFSTKAPNSDDHSDFDWWSCLLSDCGYRPNVPLSKKLPPECTGNQAIPVLRIGGNRDHEVRSRASSSRDMKADKGKAVACRSPNDDEENEENADLIAPDKYTPLLGDSFPPYGVECGSPSRAGGDLTSEVDFIEPSSHCPLPEAVATGCDDSTSAYAEYKAFAEQHPFTPADAYIPEPAEEYSAAEAASSGGQPFCDQFLSWGVMDSYSLPATSSPFLSWDGLGSPFFISQAYSAFQVEDTADGDGLLGQTSYNLEPSIPSIDGGGLDLSAIDYPPAFQEFYAEESSYVQPSAPETEAEGRNLPYSNPPPSDFDDGGSPPLGLEALSEHGVDWPTRARPSLGLEDEDLWNFLVDRVRAVVDSEDPPPIDVSSEC
ncbi:hypothetical protein Taro_022810 [Colocasia esculenta]|uniref:Uncharacterized protein n=1 Tax=Colocasia esculenta TaxID=4460 RepID=A0A843VCH6_COLES|nr:hypothetical protein [Colocasia esculenta]